MKTIAEEIRFFLKASGVRQAALAEASGVPASTICNILKGKRKNLIGPNQDAIRNAIRMLDQPTPQPGGRRMSDSRRAAVAFAAWAIIFCPIAFFGTMSIRAYSDAARALPSGIWGLFGITFGAVTLPFLFFFCDLLEDTPIPGTLAEFFRFLRSPRKFIHEKRQERIASLIKSIYFFEERIIRHLYYARLVKQFGDSYLGNQEQRQRGEMPVFPIAPRAILGPEQPQFDTGIVSQSLAVSETFLPLRTPLHEVSNQSPKKRPPKRKQPRHIRRPVHKIPPRKVCGWRYHFTRRNRGRATASGNGQEG
jgi:transcriptional regulator with XRE-family HTH domain